mmetsp:Transcript_23009/g.47800  ORF Transcript_23009/g.47800 Transcript_23009/m.47800 type:complete len:321 (+) Transcript_23009:156-1118(+)
MKDNITSTTMIHREANTDIIKNAMPSQVNLANNVDNQMLIFAMQTCNPTGFPRSALYGMNNTELLSSRQGYRWGHSNLDSNASYHGLDFLADICMIKHNLAPSGASSLSSCCSSPMPPMRKPIALTSPESCGASSRDPASSDDELKCLKLTLPPSTGNTRKDMDNARWVSRFNELVDFYCTHKHPNVPFRYSANPKLGGWVQKQRDFKKKSKLAPFKENALNSIGFNWVLEKKRLPKVNREGIYSYEDLWEFRFDQLKEFKAVNGHCNVPYRYSIDPTLGRWVQNQREFRKKRTLRKDRVERLEELGFQWIMRKGNTSRS